MLTVPEAVSMIGNRGPRCQEKGSESELLCGGTTFETGRPLPAAITSGRLPIEAGSGNEELQLAVFTDVRTTLGHE